MLHGYAEPSGRTASRQAIVAVDGRRAPVGVLDAIDKTAPDDLVLVTILSHHVDVLIPRAGDKSRKNHSFHV
jgi:hypothetical protein